MSKQNQLTILLVIVALLSGFLFLYGSLAPSASWSGTFEVLAKDGEPVRLSTQQSDNLMTLLRNRWGPVKWLSMINFLLSLGGVLLLADSKKSKAASEKKDV
jgi:hypothetical protein